MNKVIKSQPGFSESELNYLQKKYQFKFPKELYNHFLTYKGGTFEKCFFLIEDSVQIFSSFPSRIDEFEEIIDLLVVEERLLPKGLYPFGDDFGGYIFCFSVREEDAGKIYLWQSDLN